MVLGKTRPVAIETEMRSSYLDYAMSVIVSRALPDVRDGLKPVQRRILYAMNDMGITFNSATKKSARIVGEVLGKYHPHGDASVYDAMVRLAQPFSMRYPLIDGQGNFGSVDNDPPAAMRYTEARLTQLAAEMLADIDRNTVDFASNFDDSLTEPLVLPTKIPNLLLNGSAGIAVGMATSIPPHNLGELADAITYLIDKPTATVEELTQFVKGPDFPTAGIILGRDGIKSAYATGHGRIVVQAKAYITEATETERRQIVVVELPYQTNKAALVERIATLVASKKIEGISELRDESDRQGIRVVIDLKRDAQPQKVLNSLYRHTAMQSAFFVNMLALVDGQPRVISLKEALQYFIDFRREVITRRSRFDLKGAKERAHILEGLKIALDQIDKVIATIRQSENAERARQSLMTGFGLSQIQAQAILDMQLRRLANLERQRILDEYAEVLKTIAYLEELLANPKRVLALIKEESETLKSKFGDERRTEISDQGEVEFREEDLIPHARVVVTLSNRGFVKRIPSQVYNVQHRGGKGIVGMVTREDDAVRLLTVADTHDNLLFFTNRGRVFRLKCYEIPESSRTSKGMAVINLFPIAEAERVTEIVAVTNLVPDSFLLLATSRGEIKKTSSDNFAVVRSNGLIAMNVEPGDELVAASLASDKDQVIMITQKGQSIRFVVSSLRSSSRTSGGVRGIRLDAGDKLVSMDVAFPEGYVLISSVEGYGKLTPIDDYRLQGRGGSGIKTLEITEKTGDVAAAEIVTLTQQVMLISAKGMVIHTPVREKDPTKGGIRISSRATQGVKLMNLDEGDKVVAITAFD
ncbi:MAG: DNA gyrase subunit A [Chloroflexi bacterium]|nr:DNA gyrase subunit A [Chloroflexota bacterium]